MKTHSEHFSVDKLTAAMQTALAAMLVMPLVVFAADDDIQALTQPTNSVEIGVSGVSSDSAKFGEYYGLNKSEASLIGNFNIRGGDAYKSFDGGTGTNRWEINGSDLGTTSREVSGTVSNQGRWDLGVSYDELQHNSTDSYQTPFQGSMGGNNFYLPATFGVIDVNGPGTQALTPIQLSSFHTEDVYTSRKNLGFKAGYQFDRQWNVKFDFNRLEQSGAKLIGAAFDANGGGAGENSTTLMNPTNYQTDTYRLSVNWMGEKAHITGSYFGSLFTDKFDSVSWSNPFVDSSVPGYVPPTGEFPINTFATAPSNQLHQFKLSGEYEISPDTQVSGSLSYGRNTQNVSFINDPLLTSTLPVNSLNGLVITTHADLKVTNQTTKDLILAAGFKFNERNNQTPSYTYDSFNSVAGDPWLAAVNTPVSNKSTQVELTGNYRLDKKQSVFVAFEHENVQQWCNNALANSAQSPDVVANYPNYYTTPACVQSPESNQNQLSVKYKLKATDDLNLNVGYGYSRKNAAINDSYYNPMQTSFEGLQNLGFLSPFNASRTEQTVRTGINWQANDKLNVGLNGRYVKDDYDATLGVQSGYAWGLNLDAAYQYSEDFTISGYLSAQHRQRDLLASNENAPQTVSTQLWSNRLTDDNTTIGITAKKQGLMGSKLTITGDLSYSLGTSGYSTQVLYADPLCTTYGITCGSLPDIKSEMLRLKITGIYQVDKSSKIAVNYMFRRLISNDYYYSAYQTGYTDVTVMPTNQKEPSYTVNAISVSYIYSF
jgi:MtrB/PioB family decaheme-associated outer membrane protein